MAGFICHRKAFPIATTIMQFVIFNPVLISIEGRNGTISAGIRTLINNNRQQRVFCPA